MIRVSVGRGAGAFFAALAVLVLLGWGATARAGEPTLPDAQWQAIQNVIGAQLAALKAGDARAAFGHAAPGIQAQFGNPEGFMAMVRDGYAALLEARYTEFLEGAVIDGRTVQPLRLVGPDQTVRVALYFMERDAGGTWRIAGCVIAPSRVQAV